MPDTPYLKKKKKEYNHIMKQLEKKHKQYNNDQYKQLLKQYAELLITNIILEKQNELQQKKMRYFMAKGFTVNFYNPRTIKCDAWTAKRANSKK